MFAPQSQSEFFAYPFGLVEKTGIDGFKTEQPRTLFGFVYQSLHQARVSGVDLGHESPQARIKRLKSTNSLILLLSQLPADFLQQQYRRDRVRQQLVQRTGPCRRRVVQQQFDLLPPITDATWIIWPPLAFALDQLLHLEQASPRCLYAAGFDAWHHHVATQAGPETLHQP